MSKQINEIEKLRISQCQDRNFFTFILIGLCIVLIMAITDIQLKINDLPKEICWNETTEETKNVTIKVEPLTYVHKFFGINESIKMGAIVIEQPELSKVVAMTCDIGTKFYYIPNLILVDAYDKDSYCQIIIKSTKEVCEVR